MINKVILVGNLGRDPELRHLEGGAKVARFSVATNENYKDKSGEWQKLTEWHDVVAWSGLADYAERWLKKGGLVYVEGKLTHRKYQDKDGNDRYVTEIRSAVLRSMERRDGDSDQSRPAPSSQSPGAGFDDRSPLDDDLPF